MPWGWLLRLTSVHSHPNGSFPALHLGQAWPPPVTPPPQARGVCCPPSRVRKPCLCRTLPLADSPGPWTPGRTSSSTLTRYWGSPHRMGPRMGGAGAGGAGAHTHTHGFSNCYGKTRSPTAGERPPHLVPAVGQPGHRHPAPEPASATCPIRIMGPLWGERVNTRGVGGTGDGQPPCCHGSPAQVRTL